MLPFPRRRLHMKHLIALPTPPKQTYKWHALHPCVASLARQCLLHRLLEGSAAVLNKFEELASLEVEVLDLPSFLFEIDACDLDFAFKFANGEERGRWCHCGGVHFRLDLLYRRRLPCQLQTSSAALVVMEAACRQRV